MFFFSSPFFIYFGASAAVATFSGQLVTITNTRIISTGQDKAGNISMTRSRLEMGRVIVIVDIFIRATIRQQVED